MTELSATTAEPAYINRLALKQLPFSNVIHEGAFFEGSHLKQRRLLLQHLLRATARPILVHAPAGTGKTTLVKQLQQQSATDLRFCVMSADTDEQAAYQYVTKQLDAHSQTVNTADIKERLGQLRRLNITPVLLVDDIEQQTDVGKQRLSDWLAWQDDNGKPLWQAIVCCEYSALEFGNFQSMDVPPLELAEIEPYLSQRMAAVGFTGELPFSDKDIRRFYRLSSGIPAKINQLAHQHLLEPVKKGHLSLTLPPFMKQFGRWSVVFILALFIIVLLMYQQNINDWIDNSDDSEVLTLPEPIQQPEIATVVVGETEQGESSRQELADLLAEIPAVTDEATTELSTESEEVIAAEKPEEQATESPVTLLVEQQADATVVKNQIDSDTHGADWVMSQTATSYTFQLMGSWEQAEVDQFIDKHALTGDVAQFTSLRDAKPWHVLIYGVYASKKAALQASNNWPAPLNTVPTWLRRFDSVQQQIKEKGVTP